MVLLRPQPGVAVFLDETVVLGAKMRVTAAYAIDLFALAGRESAAWIQGPEAFQQALTSQNFVNTGNTAREVMGRVEDRGIHIGNLLCQRQLASQDRISAILHSCKQLYSTLRPHSPMAQQAADDARPSSVDLEFR